MSEEIRLLWESLNGDLRSFIFSRVKNDADTDDILQEVFIKIHENISGLKDSSKIRSWIYQITRNLIIDKYRKDKQEVETTEIIKTLPVSSASTRFMYIAINDMIKMMDQLPPEYCEALCMTELEGMSQKEYAELKRISYSGARSRVQRARAILKDMLLQCCHYQFDRYGTIYHIQPKCCCC